MDTSHSHFSRTQNVGIPAATYTVPVSLCILVHVMKVKEEFVYFFQLCAQKNGNLVLQVVCVLSVMTLAQQSNAQGTVH
jgi:hypothetical protein